MFLQHKLPAARNEITARSSVMIPFYYIFFMENNTANK